MKCAVLGAGGFIGINLCQALLGRVDQLRAFNRTDRSIKELAGLEWVLGDFDNPESVKEAVNGCDTVIHLINTIPVHTKSGPIIDVQKNVVSTLQLLDTCCEQGIKKIIFISSGGSVYGISDILPTPEYAATEPITAYGVSKLTIEKYLAHYRHTKGLEYRILRVANPYGPYQTISHNHGVIAVFIQRALMGLPIEIWGDGSTIRDYIYIHDVVQAIIKVMDYEGPEHIFNIGSGKGLSLEQVVKAIEQKLKCLIEVKYTSQGSKHIPVSILDIRKAGKYLEWKPQYSFDEGLSNTIDWLQERSENIPVI